MGGVGRVGRVGRVGGVGRVGRVGGVGRVGTADNPCVADHHSVYVVYLKDPKGDGRAAYYVGMTGLTPEERFLNHKAGLKAARVVKKHGVRLVPKLYAHLNPMPYQKAVMMEVALAESLRKRGYVVYGGH